MGEQGDLNETSLAIGELRATVTALQTAHAEKARKDDDFRKAGYEAFGVLKQIAGTQAEHAAKLEQHDKRLDGHDKSRSWAKGVIAAVGVVATGAGTLAGMATQFFTSGNTTPHP